MIRHEIVSYERRNLSFEITLSERASLDSSISHSFIYAAIDKGLSTSSLAVRGTPFSCLNILINEAMIHVELTIMEKWDAFIEKVSALVCEHWLHLDIAHISSFKRVRECTLVDEFQNLIVLDLMEWIVHAPYEIFKFVFGFEISVTSNERLGAIKLASTWFYVHLNVLIVHYLLPRISFFGFLFYVRRFWLL